MPFKNFSTTLTTTTTEAPESNLCTTNGYSFYGYDKFSCFLFKLPFILFEIKFGYFVAGLTTLIILISIFGRIKLHYRWFILNMALIDLFNSYDFVCAQPQLFAPVLESPSHNCPVYTVLPFDSRYMVDIVPHLPSIGVFLLSFSRFISVYFPNFYKNVAKTWTVLLFIASVNILYISSIFILYKNRYDTNTEIYFKVAFYQAIEIPKEREETLKDAANVKFMLAVLYSTIPAIILLFSILFFTLLGVKIIRRLKFQAKTNKEMFKINIRIITVLSVHTLMLCILMPLEAIYQMNQPVSPDFEPYYPYFNFPPWIYGLISENGVRCFREFRVFIDSLIILIFMKGYREDLFATIKWIIKNVTKVWNGLRYGFGKSSVKPIQTNFTNNQNSFFTVTIQTF